MTFGSEQQYRLSAVSLLSNSIQMFIHRLFVIAAVLVLSACGSTPDKSAAPQDFSSSWSINRVVHTDHSMITLLDPSDLLHHRSDPANWYLHDFAIKDDLQTGRFAAVLTERSGKFNVRVTFGELTADEAKVAGAEAKLRLRVINHRLLLSGGDAWPSEETDYRRFAHDPRWIGLPNGDYGVIITALKPNATASDYVFQLIRVDDMAVVKHAPGVPQLIYGEKASVVGVNTKGFQFYEQCLDVPGKASWAPLSSRTMPIPGAKQALEIPRSMHTWALKQQEAGNNATLPVVLSRNPEVGSYGFYVKPQAWTKAQLQSNGDAVVRTLVRCAVQITEVVATPDDFSLRFKAVPTATDRLRTQHRQQLLDGFNAWLRSTNDPALHFKSAKVERSANDAALILGIVDYLQLSSKESEKMLPLSNALRVDYLLDRFNQ